MQYHLVVHSAKPHGEEGLNRRGFVVIVTACYYSNASREQLVVMETHHVSSLLLWKLRSNKNKMAACPG